jgi:hypothetical protein
MKSNVELYNFLKDFLSENDSMELVATDAGDGVIEIYALGTEFSLIHREDTDEVILIKKPVATPC